MTPRRLKRSKSLKRPSKRRRSTSKPTRPEGQISCLFLRGWLGFLKLGHLFFHSADQPVPSVFFDDRGIGVAVGLHQADIVDDDVVDHPAFVALEQLIADRP